MTFNRSRSRFLAVATAAMMLAASSTTEGCSGGRPVDGPPSSQPLVSPTICSGPDCPQTFNIDDFICPGVGCTASIERNCLTCGPATIDYRTEDMVAKSGQDYVGVRSGQVHFADGATSATLTITTIPRKGAGPPRTFRVVLSVDGTVVDEAVGTITDV